MKKSTTENIKNLIYLLEISGLLHDLGKLSFEFLSSKTPDFKGVDTHGQILFKDLNKLQNHTFNFFFMPLQDLLAFFSKRASPTKKEEKIFKLLELDKLSISHFLCAHHGCKRCSSPFLKEKGKCKISPEKNPLIRLLRIADKEEASNPSNKGKQEINKIFLKRPLEEKKTLINPENLSRLRFKFYENLENVLERNFLSRSALKKLRDELLKLIEVFKKSLSETRVPANDLTLFDHSFAASSIFKSLSFYFLEKLFNRPLKASVKNGDFSFIFEELSMLRPMPLSFLVLKKERKISKKFEAQFYFVTCVLKFKTISIFLTAKQNKNSKILKTLKGLNIDYKILPFDFKKLTALILEVSKSYSLAPLKEIFKLPLKTENDIELKKIKEDFPLVFTAKDFSFKKNRLFNLFLLTLDYAYFLKREEIEKEYKSISKHFKNVLKGKEKNKNTINHLKSRVDLLERKLMKLQESDLYLKRWELKSKEEMEYIVYYFFKAILSPIRPPSLKEMSLYLAKSVNEFNYLDLKGRIKRKVLKEFNEFLFLKPITLGRFLSIFEGETLRLRSG